MTAVSRRTFLGGTAAAAAVSLTGAAPAAPAAQPALWFFPEDRLPDPGLPWPDRQRIIESVSSEVRGAAITTTRAALTAAGTRHVDIIPVGMPEWALEWIRSPVRNKAVDGGRGSGKTTGIARALIYRMMAKPIIVACAREFQQSIRESAKPAIEAAIQAMGVAPLFDITDRDIRCRNGSRAFFAGLERNRDSIRGWHDVDICWVEEAQRLSTASARILIPTVRARGSELWFSFNRTKRTDWVDRRFKRDPGPGSLVLHRNWECNPWFPKELDDDRQFCRDHEPADYPHIWGGEPDDAGAANQVLPYALLLKCVQGHREGLHIGTESHPVEGPLDIGLDVADNEAGGDWNASAVRRGPVLIDVRRWRGRVAESARRGHRLAMERQAWGLWYDAGGVGAGCRGYFDDHRTAITLAPDYDPQRPLYTAHPIQFGEGVAGATKRYSQRATNAAFFARRNIQMAWGLRLRAMRTARLLAGEDIDPLTCLFIPEDLPDLEAVLAEMSQEVYTENPVTGKLELDKRPDGEPSPDMADAVKLAFARDSRYGLRAT